MTAEYFKPTDLSAPGVQWWFCPRVPIDRWKAKSVEVMHADGTICKAHWACDLSGEDQPPFIGWFTKCGNGYREIPQPMFWRRCHETKELLCTSN